MKNVNEFEDECQVEDVPVSPLLAEQKRNPYGSVEGLDDEELADPAELERQAFIADWGPILALPVRTRRGWVQPNIDENGNVDWGAFGTVDFERSMGPCDKLRYKADRLQEKRRDVLIMYSIVSNRLPKARYKVLKLLEKGIIELEDIGNEDMLALARYYLQARSLEREIRELRKASWTRRQRRIEKRFAEVLR
jgi:hypothetical protein